MIDIFSPDSKLTIYESSDCQTLKCFEDQRFSNSIVFESDEDQSYFIELSKTTRVKGDLTLSFRQDPPNENEECFTAKQLANMDTVSVSLRGANSPGRMCNRFFETLAFGISLEGMVKLLQ
jgi:hypothetical protein